MLPFRRLLFPVDYSQPCRALVPYLKDMLRHTRDGAPQTEAELILVHSYGPEALAYSDLPLIDPELPSEARAIQEKRLIDFALETFPDQHAECVVECGEP